MTIEQSAGEEIELPDDLDEAEELLRDLQSEVIDLQTQLGNRDRRHPDGTRFSNDEYWEWRNRAAWAWRHRSDELREVKAHVKRLRIQAYAATARPPKPRSNGTLLVDEVVRAYRAGDAAATTAAVGRLAAEWTIIEYPPIEDPRP